MFEVIKNHMLSMIPHVSLLSLVSIFPLQKGPFPKWLLTCEVKMVVASRKRKKIDKIVAVKTISGP